MTTPAIRDLIDPIIEGLGASVQGENYNFEVDGLTEYLRADYLESRSEERTYGSDRIPSILQVRVYVKNDTGARSALIQLILDTFPKNKTLTSADASIRVDRAPTVGPSISDNGWYFVPVTIPYEVFR
tara:strand:+ start:173 stop:556 length:384 start_codon:yes stop_codon:yes gene_type:complete